MVITSKKKKVELLNEKFVLSRGKKSIANSSKINLFLSLWESRLDICLWKANLVPSISISRELIHSGFIEVNGKIVKKQSKLLQKGDFVQIK
jgi:ribosomal protein S4